MCGFLYLDMKLLCSSSCVRRCVLVGYQVQREVFVLYTTRVCVQFLYACGFCISIRGCYLYPVIFIDVCWCWKVQVEVVWLGTRGCVQFLYACGFRILS